MRYLKKFNLFEAVIMPDTIDDDSLVDSFESAVKFGKKHGFDVVDYDEFYNSLSPADKRNAPPRKGVPFFALFHPERGRAMFVLAEKVYPFQFIPNFKQVMLDIIGHERVHGEQARRRGDVVYSLPSPLDRKAYFSNKDEVMAFSFSIASDLAKVSNSLEEAMNALQTGFRGQNSMIWNSIKSLCDEKTIRRYRKYIYMYLDKMFNEEDAKA